MAGKTESDFEKIKRIHLEQASTRSCVSRRLGLSAQAQHQLDGTMTGY